MNPHVLPPGLFLERLAVATLLGLAIGLERQWRQRTAGLHTSTLVAAGACLFVSVPELAGSQDTWRVVAQVVSGVGFLAGGVILRDGFNVRGLITAATLWATAAVGVLAGTGHVAQAAVGGAVIITTNLVCMPLAGLVQRIPRAAGERLMTTYTLRIGTSPGARESVRQLVLHEIGTTSLILESMASSPPVDGAIQMVVQMTKPGSDDGAADRMQAAVLRLDGVTSAQWEADERAS